MRSGSILATALLAMALMVVTGMEPVSAQAPDRSILTEGEHAFGYVLPSEIIENWPNRGADYGYDVDHVDMDLAIDFGGPSIDCTTTLTVTITSADLTQLPIDLNDALTVTGLTVDGFTVFFSRMPEQVLANLTSPPDVGAQLEVAVSYTGRPAEVGNKSMRFRTHAGTPLVYTLSTPMSNVVDTVIPISHYWRACKDDPGDKSTYSCAITVPDNMLGCSNGLLTSTVDNGDGTKTYYWEHDYQVAPYLIKIAATDYVTLEDTYVGPGGQTPIRHFAYPEDSTLAATDWANTVVIMETLAGLYGEYPFIGDKFGHCETSPGPAVEHQTIVSWPENIVNGTAGWDWLIAHEMAHMWWGDALTVSDWDHVWLHEGFASYAEALWAESNGGFEALRAYMLDLDTGPYTGTIVPPPYVWNTIVYNKGAWMCHMLRHFFPDDAAYFQMLLDYRNLYEGGNVVTDDFVAVAEAGYGGDLSWFFDPWLFEVGRPDYEYAWTSEPAADDFAVELTIDQIQSASLPIYKMPIDVAILTSGGLETFVVWDSLQSQTFSLVTTDEPLSVSLDPGNWILADFTEQEVDVAGTSVPAAFHLAQNAPNPVNGSTTIRFGVARSGKVALRVFDAHGRMVRTLVQGRVDAGPHAVEWDGRDTQGRQVASGQYFYRLVSPQGIEERRLLVIR